MTDLAPSRMSAPEEAADSDRLATLDGYDILDTPPEEGFDDIVRLAALACDAPMALVSLIDGERQWFKARIGFTPDQTDLGSSVCVHALAEPDLLVIPDLAADPRTRDNPLVTGPPRIRFYAGAPLRAAGGQALGSLCVVDRTPRPDGLTARQAEMLRTLARQVMVLMELRRIISGRDGHIARHREAEERLDRAAARLRVSEAHWRGLFERLDEGLIIAEVVRDEAGRAQDWRYLDVNAAWGRLVRIDPAAAVGRTVREVFPGIESAWVHDVVGVVETGEPVAFTRPLGALQRWYEGRAFPLDGDRFAILFVEVTGRVRADLRRNALLEIGDRLRTLDTPPAITRMAAAIVGPALGAAYAGFGWLDEGAEHLTIEAEWTADGTPDLAGRHRLAEYGDVRRALLLGEPVVVQDALADPRTVGRRGRWNGARIRTLVAVPMQEGGRTVAVLVVHGDAPRAWSPEAVAFLNDVADRVMAAMARVRAEDRQAMLNQELSHRMKNMLAMIQAIAGQTLKQVTEQDAVEGFRQRLHALASAQDVLLQADWAAAPMRQVVETALLASGLADRFAIRGPDVTLGPRATLSLSLLLHELATNAAKYGALSAEGGRIAVEWRTEAAMGELVLAWTERGGPPVVPPTRTGFGSRLVGAGLAGTGGVTLRYPPAGFEAEMRATLDQVQAP